MKDNLVKLIDVKSLVTLTLTMVFSILAVKGLVSADQFLTVFTTVIAFYFGVQYQKKNSATSEISPKTEKRG